jgi:serine/threonine-protein kinase
VFPCQGLIALVVSHLSLPPEPPSLRLGADVPQALERAILDCLEKDPSRRPASARELGRRLEALAAEWSDDESRARWSAQRADSQRDDS